MSRRIAICLALSLAPAYIIFGIGVAVADGPASLTCSSPEIRKITSKITDEPTSEEVIDHKELLICQTRDRLTRWGFVLDGNTIKNYKVYRYVPYTNIKTLNGPERAIPGDRSLDGKTCADPDVRPITSILPNAGDVVDVGIVEVAGAHLLVCRATDEYAFWVLWREPDGSLGYQLGGTFQRWDIGPDRKLPTEDTASPAPCSDPNQAAVMHDRMKMPNVIDLGVHLSSLGPRMVRYCTDVIEGLTIEFHSGPGPKPHFSMYGSSSVSWHDRMERIEKHGENIEIDSSEGSR